MTDMVRKNFYLTQSQQDFFESLDGNVSEHLRRAADDYIEKKRKESLNASESPESSPIPATKKGNVYFSFPEAVKNMIDGKKVTRLDWDDTNTYGVLEDGYLMIYIKGEIHKWTVTDGDMYAVDWIVLSEF